MHLNLRFPVFSQTISANRSIVDEFTSGIYDAYHHIYLYTASTNNSSIGNNKSKHKHSKSLQMLLNLLYGISLDFKRARRGYVVVLRKISIMIAILIV